MGAESLLFAWIVAFFLLVATLIIIAYQIMLLSDLENDYINPYESASQINKVVLPEFILQGTLSLLFLLTGQWMMFFVSLPVIYYNMRLYMKRQHLIHVTDVFNLLGREQRMRVFKLVYLVALLFLSLFWMIWSLVEEEK